MSIPESDFAPANITDGRQRLDWQSRYTDQAARRGILCEAWYLATLFFGTPLLVILLWLEYPRTWLDIAVDQYQVLFSYSLAWIGGMFGGTMFGIKWLYHSVAKQTWHLDRRLWRVFTPHISAGLASVVVALISSGLLQVFDRHAIESNSLVFGLAFLVGYFSDNAIAKLAEIASTIFGPVRPTGNTRQSAPNHGGK